jgi:Zn-dependent M28 family amino/carboxypeptidase
MLSLRLQEMTGATPVDIGGQQQLITNRYSPASKALFRQYWMQYYTFLGMQVTESAYTTQHNNGEAQGHNVEAVLPGKDADSVVIIVHYDSIGPAGQETQNPGVDDDMTGMATQLETARILASQRDKLQHTIRFVAADYEEWSNPGLEGARHYAQYIKNLSQQQGFKILAAVDNEQSGWNCFSDAVCPAAEGGTYIDVFSCSTEATPTYDFKAIGDSFEALAKRYSSLATTRACMDANSDHYAMWEIGVPAVVFSEHSPFANPHFDQRGSDTIDKIDHTYHFRIAQVGTAFAAQLAGLAP